MQSNLRCLIKKKIIRTFLCLFVKYFINYFFLVIILKSYLKDVLNEIAILDKRGPYNNCYHLKPEYSQQSSTASESIAPLGLEAPAAGAGSGNEGGDDDDFEFEMGENDDELEAIND